MMKIRITSGIIAFLFSHFLVNVNAFATETVYDYDALEKEMQASIFACQRHGKKSLCQAPCRSALAYIPSAKTQGINPETYHKVVNCRKNVEHMRAVVKTADDLTGDYKAAATAVKASRNKCLGLSNERQCLMTCGRAIKTITSVEVKGLPLSRFKVIGQCHALAKTK